MRRGCASMLGPPVGVLIEQGVHGGLLALNARPVQFRCLGQRLPDNLLCEQLEQSRRSSSSSSTARARLGVQLASMSKDSPDVILVGGI